MGSVCSELVARIVNLSFMEVALFLSGIILIWILWRIQRSPKQIDFVDLLIGPDGKASWSKMAGIGGFLVGTWVLIYDTLNKVVPEGQTLLFLCYFAICIGSPVAFAIVNRGGRDIRVPSPPDAQVTVTTNPPPQV